MGDVALVGSVLVFFLAAALLVRACARITAGSLDELDLEDSEEAGSAGEPEFEHRPGGLS
jgi:hypothetical protein